MKGVLYIGVLDVVSGVNSEDVVWESVGDDLGLEIDVFGFLGFSGDTWSNLEKLGFIWDGDSRLKIDFCDFVGISGET